MKGHKSVSIAPEAGTERLRKVINKRITEEDILDTASRILNGDIETLRLYFMIGLPTETMEDIAGIIASGKKGTCAFKKGLYHPEHKHLCAEAFYPVPVASHGPSERGQGKAEDDKKRAYGGKGREGIP